MFAVPDVWMCGCVYVCTKTGLQRRVSYLCSLNIMAAAGCGWCGAVRMSSGSVVLAASPVSESPFVVGGAEGVACE